jgi:hypothetical protein
MSEIVLATLNARYHHASFGLRWLFANLGPLQTRAAIREYEVAQAPIDIVASILETQPRIVGLGIYVWNVAASTEVVALLKRLRPDLVIVLGGPEVSYETEDQPIAALADHVILGEADLAFAELCATLLAGGAAPKILQPPWPALDRLALPYDHYSDADIAHRTIYVEASRGCPFGCEFCLSSLDIPVRTAPLEALLAALDRLLERGARHLKFVDRTFNLDGHASVAILSHLLRRVRPELLFHFEIIPDRLPDALFDLVRAFPPGTLQFEVGIQTFNESVATRIHRRQDYRRTEANLRRLRCETGVHLHADLIAGLPGESLESFAAGFDRLVALQPQEIQVGLLKRLRGAPIRRHDADWAMVYNPCPPYEVLQTSALDFATLLRLRRFSGYWDKVANSGNFLETVPLLLQTEPSAFRSFLRFADWLFERAGRRHHIALTDLVGFLFAYLTQEGRVSPGDLAPVLWRDYLRSGRSDRPPCLRPWITPGCQGPMPTRGRRRPNRQQRHQALNELDRKPL